MMIDEQTARVLVNALAIMGFFALVQCLISWSRALASRKPNAPLWRILMFDWSSDLYTPEGSRQVRRSYVWGIVMCICVMLYLHFTTV